MVRGKEEEVDIVKPPLEGATKNSSHREMRLRSLKCFFSYIYYINPTIFFSMLYY